MAERCDRMRERFVYASCFGWLSVRLNYTEFHWQLNCWTRKCSHTVAHCARAVASIPSLISSNLPKSKIYIQLSVQFHFADKMAWKNWRIRVTILLTHIVTCTVFNTTVFLVTGRAIATYYNSCCSLSTPAKKQCVVAAVASYLPVRSCPVDLITRDKWSGRLVCVRGNHMHGKTAHWEINPNLITQLAGLMLQLIKGLALIRDWFN